jgi:hypothetical protein
MVRVHLSSAHKRARTHHHVAQIRARNAAEELKRLDGEEGRLADVIHSMDLSQVLCAYAKLRQTPTAALQARLD